MSSKDKWIWINLALFGGVWVPKQQLSQESNGDNVMQASVVVSELLAKKLERHSEGEFLRLATAELQAPGKVKMFQASISLQDTEKTLQEHHKKFTVFLSGLGWNNILMILTFWGDMH